MSSPPPAYQPKHHSLWVDLPIEIRSDIINKSDVLTRHLNNDLTTEEIKVHGNEIWRIVFENDLVDVDLSLLPQHHLPNIDNGLGLVRSKEMYQRLGELRPDLLNNDSLKSYLEYDILWKGWLTKTGFGSIIFPPGGQQSMNKELVPSPAVLTMSTLQNLFFTRSAKPTGRKSFLAILPPRKAIFKLTWMFEGLLEATRLGKLDVIKLITTKMDPLERARACQAVLEHVARDGKMELVELLAVVEGVDVEKAKQVAAEKQHYNVVDFLVNVQTGQIPRSTVATVAT
ncbi:hypothetical protein HDU76_005658 [Blyttiomyces sp. JEL0837]|nr:hypothetical protein HDU76_005658 [Blyttiomyces sp. JEL0837]